MPTYEITYRGSDGVSHAYGKTASEAKYNNFMRLGDFYDNFRQYLKSMKSVRRVADIRGAYDFIERQYGIRFEVGQRVTIAGEGSTDGQVGMVVHPSGEGSYVSVVLDDGVGLFHPHSLILEGAGQ